MLFQENDTKITCRDAKSAKASALYLAPISVAYFHWDDFHVAED